MGRWIEDRKRIQAWAVSWQAHNAQKWTRIRSHLCAMCGLELDWHGRHPTTGVYWAATLDHSERPLCSCCLTKLGLVDEANALTKKQSARLTMEKSSGYVFEIRGDPISVLKNVVP